VLADSSVRKWAHNAPHDYHALTNEGLVVAGLEDTLQWLRVAVPGMTDYGLKSVEGWALGYPPRPGFKETLIHEVIEVRVKRTAKRGCICGSVPCRVRTKADFLDDRGIWMPHLRVGWTVFTPAKKAKKAMWAVPDMVEGHSNWESWLEYSLMDAVRGMELVDWLRGRKPDQPEYPWGHE
jgi:hypothetical protein